VGNQTVRWMDDDWAMHKRHRSPREDCLSPSGRKRQRSLALFSAAAGEWESRWACTRKWTPGHGESGELDLGSGRIGRWGGNLTCIYISACELRETW
jgi:hypothetical protein